MDKLIIRSRRIPRCSRIHISSRIFPSGEKGRERTPNKQNGSDIGIANEKLIIRSILQRCSMTRTTPLACFHAFEINSFALDDPFKSEKFK